MFIFFCEFPREALIFGCWFFITIFFLNLTASRLEKSVSLLSNEQKKNYRFNILSLGLVKNKTSENLIKNLPSNYKNKNKFVSKKLLIKKFKYLIQNKKVKNKVIRLHGGYIR